MISIVIISSSSTIINYMYNTYIYIYICIHSYIVITITIINMIIYSNIIITIHSFIHGAAIGARPVRRRQRVSLAREIRNLPQRQIWLSLLVLLLLSLVSWCLADAGFVGSSAW